MLRPHPLRSLRQDPHRQTEREMGQEMRHGPQTRGLRPETPAPAGGHPRQPPPHLHRQIRQQMEAHRHRHADARRGGHAGPPPSVRAPGDHPRAQGPLAALRGAHRGPHGRQAPPAGAEERRQTGAARGHPQGGAAQPGHLQLPPPEGGQIRRQIRRVRRARAPPQRQTVAGDPRGPQEEQRGHRQGQAETRGHHDVRDAGHGHLLADGPRRQGVGAEQRQDAGDGAHPEAHPGREGGGDRAPPQDHRGAGARAEGTGGAARQAAAGGGGEPAAQSAHAAVRAGAVHRLRRVGRVVVRSHYGTAPAGTERESAPEFGKIGGGTAEKFIFLR
mmetsp:Transcript_10675/g.21266  ORF Transcript_10675/g.21266 Transcript_10675/m.21266 type:complete len:331 (-) Transcript_10675:383-1375(-)